MSIHLHVVLSVATPSAYSWSDAEVARHWLALYPPKPKDFPARHAELCADAVRLQVLRERLADLSWFMKSLSEPIASMANVEDNCKGRFWEGRFKCQALLNENVMLAACVYVDLNPIRAGIAASVTTSRHTGIGQACQGNFQKFLIGDGKHAPVGRDLFGQLSADQQC